ncbi:MAG: dihydroorotase [Flavisolibacter sp.]|jgi:dihydroorotase
MDILIRQAHIVDPSSPFHHQQTDIFIQNGIITETGNITRKADRIIERNGLFVSPGWTDIFANFCDPGFEFNETLQTGAAAAATGGYTQVCIIPNTQPVLHNKSGIEYVIQRSTSLPVEILPIGAITKNAEGKELAEMYDMHQSGAVAFSDGTCSIQSSGLLVKALQYLKAINKTIIQLPDDRSISAAGLMNEGIVSTQLGLPGRPSIAEELMISRDIELLQYTNSKIHFTGISTAKSLSLIKEAKQRGLSVTCSVTPYHLSFKDEDLAGYDTNLKVNPPLRSDNDQQALRQGVMDGTVDCIATHHLPHDSDHKTVEFEYATYGMTGLETCFAAIRSAMPRLSTDRLVEILSINPRRILDLPAVSINNNAAANLTLFCPEEKWTVSRFQSKSKNSPFAGKELVGKPYGIINRDKVFLNE